jgi:hypothetical protein
MFCDRPRNTMLLQQIRPPTLLTPAYRTYTMERLATFAPTTKSQSPTSTSPIPLRSHTRDPEITRSQMSSRSPHQIDTIPSFYRLFQVFSKRFHASRHWNQRYIIFTTPIWILVSIISNSHSLFKFMYLVQQNKRFFVPTLIELSLRAQKLELRPSFIRDLVSLSYPSYRAISRPSFVTRPHSVVSTLVSLHKIVILHHLLISRSRENSGRTVATLEIRC